ncbi:hypothetical protein Tco_0157315 [Tanacetum coccineum]
MKKLLKDFQEELQAELEEEERLARQKEEDANIAEWDNVQAMIDADYELAARLQAQEQEELTIKERSYLITMTEGKHVVDMDIKLAKESSQEGKRGTKTAVVKEHEKNLSPIIQKKQN